MDIFLILLGSKDGCILILDAFLSSKHIYLGRHACGSLSPGKFILTLKKSLCIFQILYIVFCLL